MPRRTVDKTPGLPARRDALLERAIAAFVHHLPEKELPDDHQIRTAVNEAGQYFTEKLTDPEWLAQLLERAEVPSQLSAYARMELTAWKQDHPLQLPAPTFSEQVNGAKLAIMVMLGTLAGGLLLSGAFNFLSDDPRTGQVLGSIIGAGTATLMMWYASENKGVRRYLAAALGLATAAEVAILFGRLSGMGTLWGVLRSRIAGVGILAGLRRFFVYFGVVVLLRMSVRKPLFDRIAYQNNTRICFELWLDHAQTFLKNLLSEAASRPQEHPPDERKALKRLGGYLHKIHQSAAAELPASAAEMILAARNIGFDGLEGEPVFISGAPAKTGVFEWGAGHATQYNTLGVIDDGDPVFVESPPVVQDGKVIAKGSVRKVRSR